MLKTILLLFMSLNAFALPVSIMTYNVENLFDTSHDVNTEDYTYLPLVEKNKQVKDFCKTVKNKFYQKECRELDWNKSVLKAKLENISKVIKSYNSGNGPDNILLAEVENNNVLNMLVKEYLTGLGYKTIALEEGPDKRGIDTAFISKFEMVGSPKLHLIPDNEYSRGVLEVTVKISKKHELTFLVAHFPSQQNPIIRREKAVKFVKGLMENYIKQGRAVVLGGDLNISAEEEAVKSFFKNDLTSVGDVSHLIACKNCAGTHFYKNNWSFLDTLVFSKNLKTLGFSLNTDSVSVLVTAANVDASGKPIRFNPQKKIGASDHLPLTAILNLKD